MSTNDASYSSFVVVVVRLCVSDNSLHHYYFVTITAPFARMGKALGIHVTVPNVRVCYRIVYTRTAFLQRMNCFIEFFMVMMIAKENTFCLYYLYCRYVELRT